MVFSFLTSLAGITFLFPLFFIFSYSNYHREMFSKPMPEVNRLLQYASLLGLPIYSIQLNKKSKPFFSALHYNGLVGAFIEIFIVHCQSYSHQSKWITLCIVEESEDGYPLFPIFQVLNDSFPHSFGPTNLDKLLDDCLDIL